MFDIQGITEDRVNEELKSAAYFFFSDWPVDEGIGSSDWNASVRSVIRGLGLEDDSVDDITFMKLRLGLIKEANQYLTFNNR